MNFVALSHLAHVTCVTAINLMCLRQLWDPIQGQWDPKCPVSSLPLAPARACVGGAEMGARGGEEGRTPGHEDSEVHVEQGRAEGLEQWRFQ